MSENSAVCLAPAPPALFSGIRKRNGVTVPFRAEKITAALVKAARVTGNLLNLRPDA